MSEYTSADLTALASQCDTGAADLRAAGRDDAACAASKYADRLRAEATAGGPVTEDRYRQAEKVAQASGLGGFLVDGGPLNQCETDRAYSQAEADRIRERHAAEAKEFEASGAFTRVAEDGQVPYWQLTDTDDDVA